MKSAQLIILMTAFVLGAGNFESASAKENKNINGSLSVKGKSKSEYSLLAKISLQEAMAIAAKASEGTITEASLDWENGFLVYEIEMSLPDQSRKEFLIDAGDGKILLTKDKRKKSSSDDE